MRDRLESELADRYRIERELGRGGMATVWLARDLRHDRSVAIKVLHAELAGAIGVDRFVREVRLTANLQHPGIVPVLDSGALHATDSPPLPWYAMSYIAGESLRARIGREVQLPIDEALRIARAVAETLAAAHQQGVIHRDIKPENIILDGNRVFVVDFGIAKALIDTGDERLTSTGLALGTPVYMSPEQASGGVVDARSDQYSLATVLYEMLVGEPPFTGPNAQVIVARRFAEPARAIRPLRSTIPEHVESAVLKALERVPADRFADVEKFSSQLELGAPLGGARGMRVAPRRRRLLGLLGVVTGLVALALVSWSAFARRERKAVARDPELLALYQRGVRGYDQRTPAGSEESIRLFKAAIARDSSFAQAWVGLAKSYARAYERRFVFSGVVQDSVLRLALRAADRGLALDSTDADAWVARAIVSRLVDPTDVNPAIRAARKAIALDSLNAPAWHFLAVSLAEMGDIDSALSAWRQSVHRSPTYTQSLAFLAQGHYWHKQYDSASIWADSAIAVDPNYLFGRTTLGMVAIERNEFARAIAAYDAGRRLSTDVEIANTLAGRALAEARAKDVGSARRTLRLADSLAMTYPPAPLHTAVVVAQAYAALGDVTRAIWWLKQYPVQRDLHFQIHIRCDAPFEAIAGDARYRALLVAPMHGKAC
jgi:Tfp pilus assembly protein PilF